MKTKYITGFGRKVTVKDVNGLYDVHWISDSQEYKDLVLQDLKKHEVDTLARIQNWRQDGV